MDNFCKALSEWLDQPANTQACLAAAIGKTQAAVQRYKSGSRFPDAETARKIAKHTGGAVPFSVWYADFLVRFGINGAKVA